MSFGKVEDDNLEFDLGLEKWRQYVNDQSQGQSWENGIKKSELLNSQYNSQALSSAFKWKIRC